MRRRQKSALRSVPSVEAHPSDAALRSGLNDATIIVIQGIIGSQGISIFEEFSVSKDLGIYHKF